MATQVQLRNDTTANWNSANPILAKGELGIEFLIDGSVKTKIGNGITNWTSLTYNTIGATGAQGPIGATGTGLSRTTTATLDFGANEDTYVELTINDAAISSSSVIQVIVTDSDFILQRVRAGVLSINNGVSYTLWGMAPEGASGTCSINVLIYQ